MRCVTAVLRTSVHSYFIRAFAAERGVRSHPSYLSYMPTTLERLTIGLRRHPVRFAIEVGVSLSAMWSLIEPAQAFLQLSLGGWPRFSVLLVAAVLIGAWRAMPSDSKTARIPGTTSCITIQYSDLFAERGVIAVPVNDFYDSAIGPHVSARSVHGQTIAHLFNGDGSAFEKAVDASLAGIPYQVVTRTSGRSHCYPIGTTAYLGIGRPNILAFVLTNTDLNTLKVEADVPKMWKALHGLWETARVHCNDTPLALPLVGGALAGVGLSPQHLLSLIVMSAASETRQKRICADIRICLIPALRGQTDIDAAFQLLN